MAEKSKIMVKDLCAFMHAMERKLGLLDVRFDHIPIWPVIREEVFHELAKQLGIYQDPKPRYQNVPIGRRIFLVGRGFFSMIFSNPFFARLLKNKKRYALLVSDHKMAGKDLFSDQVMQELKGQVMVLDSSYFGATHPKAYDLAALTVWARMWLGLKQRLRPYRDVKALKSMRQVEQAIASQFGEDVHVRVKDIAIRRAALFKAQFHLFKRLFLWKRINHVYIANPADYPHIISAAKGVGARVSGLQNGPITPAHLGYSWPGRPVVPNAPHEMLFIGRHWQEGLDLPEAVKTRTIGSPYINELRAQGKRMKTPNNILFASESVIGFEIFDIAAKVAKALPKHTISVFLDQNDTPRRYRSRIRSHGGLPRNMKIFQRPRNFYERLGSFDLQIGVSSFTLFEGMVFGNRTMLLGLPGVELMKSVLERGDALLARNAEELLTRMGDAPAAQDTTIYFSRPVKRITPEN